MKFWKNMNLNFLVILSTGVGGGVSGTGNTPSIFKVIEDFISVWPLHQWISTLVTLGLFYLLILRWIDKKVFNWKVGIILYILDIVLNLSIDILVLHYAVPIFLLKMVQMCPLSLSAIIILIEGIIYYFFFNKKK